MAQSGLASAKTYRRGTVKSISSQRAETRLLMTTRPRLSHVVIHRISAAEKSRTTTQCRNQFRTTAARKFTNNLHVIAIILRAIQSRVAGVGYLHELVIEALSPFATLSANQHDDNELSSRTFLRVFHALRQHFTSFSTTCVQTSSSVRLQTVLNTSRVL